VLEERSVAVRGVRFAPLFPTMGADVSFWKAQIRLSSECRTVLLVTSGRPGRLFLG